MNRQQRRAQKINLPKVPKYAFNQNLAWVRCLNWQGEYQAVVQDMVDVMVIFSHNNPNDHRAICREDWEEFQWGKIMIETLKQVTEQSKFNPSVGVCYNQDQKTLVFKLDNAWVSSINDIERKIYGNNIH